MEVIRYISERKIIEAFKPDAIITLHEAPSSNFLIHSNKHLEDKVLFQMLKDTERLGIVLATEDYLGQKLKVPGNSKIKGHLKFLKNLVQVQALGDYASKRGIIEITTESGWNSQDTFQRVNSHVFTISSFVDNYEKTKKEASLQSSRWSATRKLAEVHLTPRGVRTAYLAVRQTK